MSSCVERRADLRQQLRVVGRRLVEPEDGGRARWRGRAPTASSTQSWIGASLVWHMRQMSPASTSCSSSVAPASSTTRTVPAAAISKVLSCEPYSSAFCAIRPTFGVVPIVAGSKAPCSRQWSTVSRVQRRVGGVGDHELGVLLLAGGVPHLAGGADRRRHRGVDDHVARHVQVRDAAVGVDHRDRRAGGEAARSPRDRVALASGAFDALSRRARPSLGLTPAARGSAPCAANSSPTKARTAWPKMIGSETFIIVAFRWTEKSTPCSLASATCSARNALERGAAHDGRVDAPRPRAPATRLAQHGDRAVGGDVLDRGPRPRAVDRHRLLGRAEVAVAHRRDVRVRVAATRRPSSAGALRANALTEAGARRSELPSRRTGLTALPLTAS